MGASVEDLREDQARFLVDLVRRSGGHLMAMKGLDGYSLSALGLDDLSGEIRSQLREFEHEVLVLLCEEDLFGGRA